MNFLCLNCGAYYYDVHDVITRCTHCKNGVLVVHSFSHDNIDNRQEKALRYNEGKLQWHLMYFPFIEGIIKVLEFGAKKYEPNNWMKPMDRDALLDSSMRHHVAMMKGEWLDPESGLPHLYHLGCNLMFYSYHYGSSDLHNNPENKDTH